MADIDIGEAAIDRNSYGNFGFTRVNQGNPANDTGTITSVQIYAVSGYDLVNCEVATFSASGNSLTSRDSEVIGSVASGSVQTFPGLDMDVEAGDYIGEYITGGRIEYSSDTGTGSWWVSGDKIPCTGVTFSLSSPRAVSLYGEGDLPPVGWTGKISGVTNPAKVMGVDVANIAKVKGVA